MSSARDGDIRFLKNWGREHLPQEPRVGDGAAVFALMKNLLGGTEAGKILVGDPRPIWLHLNRVEGGIFPLVNRATGGTLVNILLDPAFHHVTWILGEDNPLVGKYPWLAGIPEDEFNPRAVNWEKISSVFIDPYVLAEETMKRFSRDHWGMPAKLGELMGSISEALKRELSGPEPMISYYPGASSTSLPEDDRYYSELIIGTKFSKFAVCLGMTNSGNRRVVRAAAGSLLGRVINGLDGLGSW